MLQRFMEIGPNEAAGPSSSDAGSHFVNIGPNGTNIGSNGTDIGPIYITHNTQGIESGINIGPLHIGPNGIDFVGIGTSYLAIAVGIANICLLVALIYVYMKNYRQLKSKFTMGLLVFASLLLLQNVISTSFLVVNLILGMGHHGLDIDRPQFPLSSINIIQLIALSILLYITWE